MLFMHGAVLVTSLLTALFVVQLLFAEHAGSQRGVLLAKPLASLGFVATALAASAPDSSYGRMVVLGLAACSLGDVLLIPRGAGNAFLGGMASFAFGHMAYAVAFARHGHHAMASFVALACMLLVSMATLRWLAPRLPLDMQWPMRIYVSVISLMVTLAVGASMASGQWLIGTGALLFAASDLMVARERFVRAAFMNQLIGLPLYYAAQLLLAISV
jgi:uncharacterized membrane protein YhhN